MATDTTSSDSGQPGRLERRKARTRAAILGAAGRLFREQGYDQTSIIQIAEAADAGVGTLYGYFASKEDILRQVLRQYSDEAVNRYLEAVDEGTPAIERVVTALNTMAEFVRSNRIILLAAFRGDVRDEQAGDHPTGWLFKGFCQLIEDGIANRELRPVPVETYARELLGTYTMAMLGIGIWRGHQDDPQTLADLEQITRLTLVGPRQ